MIHIVVDTAIERNKRTFNSKLSSTRKIANSNTKLHNFITLVSSAGQNISAHRLSNMHTVIIYVHMTGTIGLLHSNFTRLHQSQCGILVTYQSRHNHPLVSCLLNSINSLMCRYILVHLFDNNWKFLLTPLNHRRRLHGARRARASPKIFRLRGSYSRRAPNNRARNLLNLA